MNFVKQLEKIRISKLCCLYFSISFSYVRIRIMLNLLSLVYRLEIGFILKKKICDKF